MNAEEMRQHKIAWIPWVLAVIALLGGDIFSRENANLRRTNEADEPGLSVLSKDLGFTRQVSDPSVHGPPAASSGTIACQREAGFLKLATGPDFRPASVRHRAMPGRAPPFAA